MNTKHDLVIPELPVIEEIFLMTKTTILDTVVYENREITEETIQHLDRESDDEYSISSLDSDDNSNEGEIFSKIERNNVTCGNCGKVFISLYHHERYFFAKGMYEKGSKYDGGG